MARWSAQLIDSSPIAALSVVKVNVLWTSDLAGLAIDPTAGPDVVQMAFPVSSGNSLAPAEPVTWLAAAWLTGVLSQHGYIAQCLVGPPPGLVLLVAGQSYDVWSKITDNPEVPVAYAGTITVY